MKTMTHTTYTEQEDSTTGITHVSMKHKAFVILNDGYPVAKESLDCVKQAAEEQIPLLDRNIPHKSGEITGEELWSLCDQDHTLDSTGGCNRLAESFSRRFVV
jgi:hypothetical protein